MLMLHQVFENLIARVKSGTENVLQKLDVEAMTENRELRRRSVTKSVESAAEESEILLLSKSGLDGEEVSQPPPKHKDKDKNKNNGIVILIITAVVGLFLFAVIYDYQTSFPPARLPQNGPQTRVQTLDSVLSPQEHIHREAAVQRLRWRLTAAYRFPDGARKRVYLINGQYPGPTIEARPGDTLEIEVENALDSEGVAIHWHGMHMRGANEQDGAVGFTQCPIPPGQTFTYEFQISSEQHGTFWYHAHDQVQRADGLYGGLIVHEPEDVATTPGAARYEYDEERLLLVGDHYHRPADDVLAWYMRHASFGNEPVPDSLVVNGVGAYDCSLVVPARPVQCLQLAETEHPYAGFEVNKRYRFRMVNVGTLAGIKLSFASSDFQTIVVEVDGGQRILQQKTASVGLLYPGERVDFITSYTGKYGNAAVQPFLEMELDGENFKYPSPSLMALHRFPIRLTNGTTTEQEQARHDAGTQSDVPEQQEAFSLIQVEAENPLPAGVFPESANLTMVVYATTLKLARLKNIPHGFMNHSSWKPQEQPLLRLPRSQWDKHQFVPYIAYDASSPLWVDLVINNIDDGSHPFHLHGMDFYVLSSCADGVSLGSLNPFDVPPEGPPCGPYNVRNPIKRDTTFVPRRGYTVIRFRADNPGIWMFHCHILWHQASGMAMGFQVGGDEETGVTDGWPRAQQERVMQFCPRT